MPRKTLGCDLIVIGTHGRRGLSRVLLGSVGGANRPSSPVPVLTLRPHLSSGAGCVGRVAHEANGSAA